MSVPTVPRSCIVLLLALAACAHSEKERPLSEGTVARNAPHEVVKDSQDTRVTDEHILAIVHTAAAASMEQAAIAKERATYAKVRMYADRTFREHGDTNAKTDAVSKKTSLTPQTSATSNALDAVSKQATLAMDAKRGKDLDRAFLDAQIEQHRAVLDTIDKTLLPSAHSADVKALVEGTRVTLVRQLAEAKDLEDKLGEE